ncbi:helix-turn-helix domain-containing protein (plasmid) [Rhizobium sp. WL3]|uniref:helix-turn-helix domain-containing protein n=1 Tax=Rhizobium sp. WL3 TaxID=2603277 RepID=UPI0011C1F0C7|nr:helix-turn-helix domain-containing protein [Rhizobium sp. WL3]QEE43731.1 helix-turn-helix domain-containing protein [Rhizobium sp. WL3]
MQADSQFSNNRQPYAGLTPWHAAEPLYLDRCAGFVPELVPLLANFLIFPTFVPMIWGQVMKDILTTANAAELLGVSIRTAQLWVESGQLPSWKTPGGHRRIPRQAVLDLIEDPAQAPIDLGANAVIFAGKDRGSDWREAGLPGSGLLIDVAEDLGALRTLLEPAPPTVLIVENADEVERKKFVASVSGDARYRQTLVFTMTQKGAGSPAARSEKRIQMRMLPSASDASKAVIDFLKARLIDDGDNPSFARPLNEKARLEAVRRSSLVGSEADGRIDRLVRLAALVTRAPIAMFTLITRDQQWFKSRIGFDGEGTPRDWAFCNETLVANEITVIEDLSRNETYKTNPTLEQPHGFRFYAGAPVRDPLGFALGSVCVIDTVPRSLKLEERDALITIAEAISNLIRLTWMEGKQDGSKSSPVLELSRNEA